MSLAEQFRQQTLPIFRHVYLRINELEQLSKEEFHNRSREANGLSVRDDHERRFEAALQSELDRLRTFIEAYSEELWVRLSRVLEKLEHSNNTNNGSGSGVKVQNKRTFLLSEDALDQLEKECNEMSESLISLEEFQRQNVLAAALLTQQHETQLHEKARRKLTSIQEVSPVIIRRMEKLLIGQRDYDPLLLALSSAYSKMRKLRSRVLGEDVVWVPPDTFVRKTTKYWIHPADVLRVKCSIIKNLPILIFGCIFKDTSAASRLIPLRDQCQKESSLISSVYLDNENLDTYHDRLIREHGASLIRVRWYGSQDPDNDEMVFVERKVHKDGWTGEESYKERAPLPFREVQDFLEGKRVPSMNESNHKTSLLEDLQHQILLRKERPNVRTEYRRVAFQESSSNRVRMSLDTNLRMIRESTDSRRQGEWCRSASERIEEQDVVHFPYAVFEIKIQGEDPPEWVEELIASGLLIEVPKFSKFLHGTAMLNGSKLKNSPCWFVANSKGIMEPAQLHEMADLSDPYSKDAADFLFPTRIKPADISGNSSNAKPYLTRQHQRQMQVSTLCHVPDNHTVLSEVLVLPSGPQPTPNSHRVVHTSVHRHRPRSNMETESRGKERRWRKVLPWRKHGMEESSEERVGENRAAAIVRTRIEPKTFFANERTFLSWLTVAVMVMFLGLSLMDISTNRGGLGLFGSSHHCHSSSSSQQSIQVSNTTIMVNSTDKERENGIECNVARVSGALIAPIALILMVYSLYMYRKRSLQILRRETVRYDDPYGPIVLTILLVTVLFLAYILSIS